MFTIIKAFAGNLLKSKVGSYVSNIFGTWRIYLLLGVVFGGYILLLHGRIKTAEFKRDRAYSKVEKIQLKLDKRDIELSTCQSVNDSVNLEIDKVVLTANQCAMLWKESKDNNAAVIEKLKIQGKEDDKQIKEIENTKPITDCDNELNSDAVNNWLRGETADS